MNNSIRVEWRVSQIISLLFTIISANEAFGAGTVKISVDEKAYTHFSKPITVPKDSDRLTIELSFLSYGLLDKVKLHYRLTGQDSASHSLSKTGNLDVSYTNLKGGKYTLNVWTEDSAVNRGNAFEMIDKDYFPGVDFDKVIDTIH